MDQGMQFQPSRRVRVRRLLLSNFRSYGVLDLRLRSDRIALIGPNGAGKTNILEALSLFAPGRGLRRAELADFPLQGGSGFWSAAVEIEGADGATQLGCGLDPSPRSGDRAPGRRYRVNRAPAASSAAFADYIRIVWLAPEMDPLFIGPPSERRKFLDRTVQTVDPSHGSRIAALERATRSRNRLLDASPDEAAWLDSIEREIAELSLAVAAARVEAAERIDRALRERRLGGDFPWGEAALSGDLEDWVRAMPALEAEDRHRRSLRDGRARDAAARRTGVGLRSADLLITHGPKGREASRCSTGEQKALLVGLLLAQAQIVADASGLAPVVLLDEAAAHFDRARRAALYADLAALGSQIWMTGADPDDFVELCGDAEFFSVGAGRVETFAPSESIRR